MVQVHKLQCAVARYLQDLVSTDAATFHISQQSSFQDGTTPTLLLMKDMLYQVCMESFRPCLRSPRKHLMRQTARKLTSKSSFVFPDCNGFVEHVGVRSSSIGCNSWQMLINFLIAIVAGEVSLTEKILRRAAFA